MRGSTRGAAIAAAILAAASMGAAVSASPASGQSARAASGAADGSGPQQGQKAPQQRSAAASFYNRLMGNAAAGRYRKHRVNYLKRPRLSRKQRLRLDGKVSSGRTRQRKGR